MFSQKIFSMTSGRAERNLINRAKVVAAVLSEYGFHVSTPDEGAFDEVEWERWNVCVEVIRRLRVCADVE